MKSKKFKWTEDLIQECIDNNNYKKLNTKDIFGKTGFILACRENPKLAEKMLKHDNIDFNSQDIIGNTGFIYACKEFHELAKKILEYDNINFNIQNEDSKTGFIIACLRHPELLIPMLNNNKIDTTLKNNEGLTGYELAKENNQKSLKIYNIFLEQEKLKHNTQNNKIKKTKSLL